MVFFFPDEKEIRSYVTCVSPIDTFKCPFKPFGDLSADDYLKFAKEDLLQAGKQSMVNSFSNSKRCFHYQIERLLYAIGLRETTKKKNFPDKVEILEKLKVIPGALLKTFNNERNLMEHEYLAPTKEQAENAIALCELLIMATREVLGSIPVLLRVKLVNDPRDLLYKLVHDECRVSVLQVKGSKLIKGDRGEYYTSRIFKFFAEEERKPDKGISLVEVKDMDIDLRKASEPEWMKVLSLFILPLKHRRQEEHLPEKPLVTIATTVQWSKWKEELKEWTGRPKKSPKKK